MSDALGAWRLGEELGRGGMGVVYAAQHPEHPTGAALKEIRPELVHDPKARAFFLREARQTLRLQHPNVVRTVGLVDEGARIGLVMERLDGQSLEASLRTGGLTGPAPLQIDVVQRVLRPAAEGLGHAHGLGVVHRDVKPGNIFLLRDGGLKVLDFGICRVVGEASLQSTQSGPPGTPAYLPPEVLLGTASTPASDVFSLGLVAFLLLTGRLPHDVAPDSSPWVAVAGLMRAYTRDLPRASSLRRDIPAHLDQLVAQMLSVDPMHRPKDGAAVAAALGGAPAAAGTALGVGGLGVSRPAPRAESGSSSTPSATRLGVGGLGDARASVSAPSGPAAPSGTRLGVGGMRPEVPARSVHPPPLQPVRPRSHARRVLVVLGVLVALGVGGVWAVRQPWPSLAEPAMSPVVGAVEVLSQPDGIRVDLEYRGRKYSGVTPALFEELPTERGVEVATAVYYPDGRRVVRVRVPVVPGLVRRVMAQP